MTVAPELAAAYRAAFYTAHLPDGTVELQVGQALPLSGPATALPRASLTVITAYNPGAERPSPAQNAAAQEALQRVVQDRGWTAYPATGYDAARTHDEPSIAIIGLPIATARALGRAFRQAALFRWTPRTGGGIVWCHPAK